MSSHVTMNYKNLNYEIETCAFASLIRSSQPSDVVYEL